MNSLEIFSGIGGLATGITQAGFKHHALVEWNKDACETVRHNQLLGNTFAQSWPLHEIDVCKFNYDSIPAGKIDLLAAGPPCQPFSLAGKHRGDKDHRNMFPEVFRAVLETSPKAILIENVRGLGRKSFSEYLDYILLQLNFPEITRHDDEKWRHHAKRLEKHKYSKLQNGLTYQVLHRVLNAADYGVPQKRERLIIVAFRTDLKIDWKFPKPTHSVHALMWDQWISGSYWARHKLSYKKRPSPKPKFEKTINVFFKTNKRPKGFAWKTVRDSICDLPQPTFKNSIDIKNHEFIPGARSYAGHTGSSWDAPAKTLKAGIHGVPGGENMLMHRNGKVRYFTVRECARLQTFPDDYVFSEVWSASTRQIGNAVPVRLAKIIATSIAKSLESSLVSKVNRPSNSINYNNYEVRRKLA